MVVGRKKVKQAERLPFVTVAQGGGRGCAEVVVRFHPDHLDEMAVFMGARRRRRLSAEQRVRLLRVGAAHQFAGRAGQNGSSAAQEPVR